LIHSLKKKITLGWVVDGKRRHAATGGGIDGQQEELMGSRRN
jgi:hypothetical protein